MNRVQVTGLACLAALIMFAAGLAVYFPGDAVARYLARTAEQGLGVPVSLAPLRPTWQGPSSERMEILTAAGPLVLRNLLAPLTWRWLTGVPLEAQIGSDGRVNATWHWNGDLEVTASSVQLQDLPQNKLAADMRLAGRAGMTASLETRRESRLPGELPPGRIDLRGDGIEVRNAQYLGTAVPTLRLDLVEGHATLGRTVLVDALTFRGDAQGTLSGTITPNLARPEESRLSLNVTLTLQRTWLNQLSLPKPLVDAFLPGGRVDGHLEGTLMAPVLTRPVRGS